MMVNTTIITWNSFKMKNTTKNGINLLITRKRCTNRNRRECRVRIFKCLNWMNNNTLRIKIIRCIQMNIFNNNSNNNNSIISSNLLLSIIIHINHNNKIWVNSLTIPFVRVSKIIAYVLPRRVFPSPTRDSKITWVQWRRNRADYITKKSISMVIIILN